MDEGVAGTLLPVPRCAEEPGAETLAVCPFGPVSAREDEFGARRAGSGSVYRDGIGHYRETWVGHVVDPQRRWAGTSGAIIRWIGSDLLRSGTVDAVMCVARVNGDARDYAYALVRDADAMWTLPRSAYTPVSIDGPLAALLRSNAESFAVIGLPCTLKALDLAAEIHDALAERVRFTVGLFCGHLKSRAYDAYLSTCAGVDPRKGGVVDFRSKRSGYPASEYGVEVRTDDGADARVVPMVEIPGRSWGYNLFMLRACEFCDDVMAEVADVSVGDAWLPDYVRDDAGTSIVVARSAKGVECLRAGAERGELQLERLDADAVIRSQAGGLRQRRTGLAYRLALEASHDEYLPPKRIQADPHVGDAFFRATQRLRRWSRRASLWAYRRPRGRGRTWRFRLAVAPVLVGFRVLAYTKVVADRLRRSK